MIFLVIWLYIFIWTYFKSHLSRFMGQLLREYRKSVTISGMGSSLEDSFTSFLRYNCFFFLFLFLYILHAVVIQILILFLFCNLYSNFEVIFRWRMISFLSKSDGSLLSRCMYWETNFSFCIDLDGACAW